MAGAALAAATAPVAEREGVVTIACESSLWAHELDLLQRDLLDRLNEALEASGAGSRWSDFASASVRFRTIPERAAGRRAAASGLEGRFFARFAGIL